MDIKEDLVLGLDLGIGSCGWAVIRTPELGGGIVALGVRTFDVPETDKERTPTNQLRRQHRGMRRVINRRRQRMNDIRSLLKEHGLLEGDGKTALRITGLDPWTLRAEGLDRRLSGPELAVVLGHIAKHRGFRSNSKRDRGANAPKEDREFYKGIETVRAALAEWRTVGEMFARNDAVGRRKRNRDGDYSRSILRDDQEKEVKFLLGQQRRMGNSLAAPDLERRFIDLAFSQRPLQDSEKLVGNCPFEPTEKRCAKRAYSFELFRFLSRLAALRVSERQLTPEELGAAGMDFGNQNGMTFKRLRKLVGLREAERFDGIPADEEGKRDVVNRSSSNGCMQGTAALRRVVSESGWNSLRATPEKLDRIAFVLTFREDIASIAAGLEEIGLEPLLLGAIMGAVEQGEFGDFSGAGHISARAARAMIPHLARGLVYSDAAAAVGYDCAERPETPLAAIANPVARKALTEALKQVKAITGEYGLPGRIHVELARDVGKSKEERDEISRGIEKRNKEKDRARAHFREEIGVDAGGAEDLLRYELWKEQNTRCLYCDEAIHPNMIVASDNSVQVDHILPWSRSGDDSFVNKTLCHARCNQNKRGATPYEWFGKSDEERWSRFVGCVESNKAIKGRKKRNYVLKDASVLEEKFRPRNLNDTKYATRLLLEHMARLYPEGERFSSVPRTSEESKRTRRVFARPGALTNRLRRGWGVQSLKKTEEGARLSDDRHHALDALIVAAMSEGALQQLTYAFQESERIGSHRDFSRLPPPWPGFLDEVQDKLPKVFVSRAERRRARGEGHAATVRGISGANGAMVVFEKKSVQSLKPEDLDRIKDPERNAALIETLRDWIARGKPENDPPKKRFGGVNKDSVEKEPERWEPIRKVSLRTNKKVDVLVRDGAAERGEMVRVDVFRKKNRRGKWEYYLVPVYPHQVADKDTWPEPPNRAVTAHKPETEWPVIDGQHEYLWPLHPRSLISLRRAKGGYLEGYFSGLDRDGGQIAIFEHQSKQVCHTRIGTRTLEMLTKYQVDRLGNRYEIPRETRTWRGAACT